MALALLVGVEGVGPVAVERLLAAFGSASRVLECARRPGGSDEVRAASRDPDGRGVPMSAAAAEALAVVARRPEPKLAAIERANVRILALGDPAYPRRLRAIDLPPRVLFVLGDAGALEAAHAVAVVGTRRPTAAGRTTAARISGALARAGAMVPSGLAVGIDGEAHLAVVHEGGTTVGVIGGGHLLGAPRRHDRLVEAIVSTGGAVVSEHAPGTAPTRGTFPRRNRVISGLSDAVVVVEAGATSGALITASWAMQQGRGCFFVPGPINAPQSAGCLAWLRDYPGEARIVAGLPQLLEDLGLAPAAAFPTPAAAFPTPAAPSGGPAAASGTAARDGRARQATPAGRRAVLPDGQRRVADAVVLGAVTVDEVVAVTGLSVGGVLAALTGLETAGLIAGAYGRYRPTARLMSGPDA